MVFSIFVEGNLACGKSTLLEYFKKFEGILVLQEEVDKWSNFHGFNLLDLKTKNPDKFQFPFQSYATLTRLNQHLQVTDKPIKLMERSLISARKCFVETVKNKKLLHEGMYYVLEEWYDYIEEHHKIQCDLFIYIQTCPEVVFQRMNARSRAEESSISLDYLKELHRKHEEVFVEQASLLPAKVLIIDGNFSKEEMLQEYKKCENEIFK